MEFPKDFPYIVSVILNVIIGDAVSFSAYSGRFPNLFNNESTASKPEISSSDIFSPKISPSGDNRFTIVAKIEMLSM